MDTPYGMTPERERRVAPNGAIESWCFSFFLAALFLEFWKRYSSEIIHRWDVSNFSPEEEHPRPEYLEQVRYVFVLNLQWTLTVGRRKKFY